MNDGGQAFPTAVSADNNGGLIHGRPGMTLRDWFAGQALIAAIEDGFDMSASGSSETARKCYAIADAMLVAREQK